MRGPNPGQAGRGHRSFAAGAERRFTAARVALVDGGAGDLLSVRQVAESLGVSAPIVYRLCDRGELAHVRVMNAIRIAPEDLAAYVAARRRGGT